jgi:hypothetical protein
MPRARAPEFHRRHVMLTEPNEHEFRKRFLDPTNKRSGTRYGEFSALVNELLARHFREKPIVTGQELEAAIMKDID